MDKQIGHYRIVAELGRGGMGVVYRAHEESLNRYVAIKVLGEHLAEDSSCVQRFVREAQSAAKLNHPNIVQIYSISEHEGLPYFAMEYVPGTSVLQLLRLKGHLETVVAVRLILQTAAGLAEAHDAGIVHRDIKPANLLINERGLLKIADFGLALMTGAASRLTATGMFMGTPGYLSPEQCLDQTVDNRTDIYSLGVTFFEMLTGVSPFSADSPLALLRQIVEVEPPDVRELNPEVDDEVRAILGRMMAKKPDQRYQSCHELIADLQAYLGHAVGTSLDAESVASGTAAAVLVPPPPAVASNRTVAATPPPPPPPSASPPVTPPSATPRSATPRSATTGPSTGSTGQPELTDPFLASPTVAMPSDAPMPRVEPIEAMASQPPPRRSYSRAGLVALLLVLGLGAALVATAGFVAWRAGWLDPVLSMAGLGEGADVGQEREAGDATSQQIARLDDEPGQPDAAGTIHDQPSGEVQGISENTAGSADAAGARTDGADSARSAAVAGDPAGDPAGGGNAPQQSLTETDTRAATSTAGAATRAGKAVRHDQAVAAGNATTAASGTTRHDPAQQAPSGQAVNPKAVNPKAANPDPSIPEGIAVIGVGERLLAGEVEAFLEKRLDRGRRPLIDERSIVPVMQLLTGTDDPDPGELARLLRPHARAMIVARAEYLGDRKLRYLGRMDTVYRSRLRISLIDLHGDHQPERSIDEVIEYNQLSVERRVEELLGPRLRRLAIALAARR